MDSLTGTPLFGRGDSPTERAFQNSAAVSLDAILADGQAPPTLDDYTAALAQLRLVRTRPHASTCVGTQGPVAARASRQPVNDLGLSRPPRKRYGWSCTELVDGVLVHSGD